MTFIFVFFSSLCDVRWESSQLNSTLKISLVSPLSRFAQRFLHKKNSLHNIMAEQGPKVGDARSLWNFTPSPGILLCACSFFLSLFVYCARLCRDDDDDDDVLVLGTFVSRVWIFETMVWKRCDFSSSFSHVSLSLSKTRLLSKAVPFLCLSCTLSKNV